MHPEIAETIALRALGWMATNEELLPVFIGASGISTDDFKKRAQESEFQCSVLDFLMMDDAWVMAFCDAENLGYDQLMVARQSLPGGAQINWT